MTKAQREKLIRLIGYIEGLEWAITDDGVGNAMHDVAEQLEELLREDEDDQAD